MHEEQYIAKRPLTIADLAQITALSSVSSSADEQYLAFVTTKTIVEENTYKDFISITSPNTKEAVKEWEGSSPKWSPAENLIAYMASYNETEFLWIYDLKKDHHKPLMPVCESNYFMGHLSIKNFEWSPDGLQIAYISADKEVLAASGEEGVKIINRLLYKTKGGRGRPAVTDNALSHVWIVDITSGVAELLTSSLYNEHSLCWSPDGSQISFISNRSQNPDDNQLHDLWSIRLSTKEIIQHTHHIGTAYQPCWSSDGSFIAFLATTSKLSTNDSPAEDTQLYILASDSNDERCLTKSLDRRIEQISWHPLRNEIYFTAGNKGTTAIYKVFVGTGEIEKVIGEDCHILEYNISKSGKHIFYTATDTTHLTEIFRYSNEQKTSAQLTGNSNQLLSSCSLQTASTFWFTSFDNLPVQGWLIKPVAFEETRIYPLILVIHGGPHNMFGYEFEDRMQLLAANGYGVLFINPRGSSGYGQAFSKGCVNNWGGGDYKDLMAGVEAAIQNNSWIDAERLGVTGQSYGGYMTNWIVTQTTRFKAAVADGGLSNLVSFAGTSLYHSLIESEFGGSAYDNISALWQCSPIRCIKNVTTPTLLLHGETDNEVPLSQAEEMYIGLQKRGVDSLFVQYIGEGHGWRPDLKPKNRYDVLKRTLAWMDKYLKN